MFEAPTSYPEWSRAEGNTQTSLECTSSSSSSLFLVMLMRNMSYFCSPKSEWEIAIEKFCDLSKPWGTWWGHVQNPTQNFNVVVSQSCVLLPLARGIKSQYN